MRFLHLRVVLIVLALTGSSSAAAADSTSDAVKARSVKTIALRLVADKDQKPVLQYVIDDSDMPPRDFDAGLVFVADDQVVITFPRFNPLEVQVSAAIADTDDPAHLALNQLLNSLVALGGILRPDLAEKFKGAIATAAIRSTSDAAAGPVSCQPLQDAQNNLRRLVVVLFPTDFSARALRAAIRTWKEDISGEGYAGVSRTIEAIATLHKDAVAASTTGKAEVEKFEQATLEAIQKSDWPSASCRTETLALYDLARLGDPAERLRELEAIGPSLKKLGDALTPFGAERDWLADETKKLRTWVVARVKVTEAKSRQVTIKAGTVAFSATDESGVTSKAIADTSGAFSLRQHRRLVPEIGVGAIFADLRRPKYVVGKNEAGTSVVAHGASDEIPLSAAVMANFVFRTNLGIGAPMLQLGALPSKDAPGIFGGAGFRFFARFGLGIGIVRWWAKDLRQDPNDPTLLSVGKPIATQKEIDDKLTWVGRNDFYVTLQYSF